MNKYVVLYAIRFPPPSSQELDPLGYKFVAIVDALDKEDVFTKMNVINGDEDELPLRLKCRSMSVGDVLVELKPSGELGTWLCGSVGWTKVNVPGSQG